MLLEIDLNLSASILKKNVWINSSQSSVDYILYLNKNMFIIKKCIYYKIYADPMYYAVRKTKGFYLPDGKIFFIILCSYTNYINSSRNACRLRLV